MKEIAKTLSAFLIFYDHGGGQMHSTGIVRLLYKICTFAVILISSNVSGMILHTDSQPTVHPEDSVVGRWSYNASCVAISPNYIITTRHQGGGVGSVVNFGGINYKVAEVVVNGNVDMRVARLETMTGQPANLTNYVSINTSTYEVNEPVLLGGYGKSRGAELTTLNGVSYPPYGYSWSGTNNLTFRWGANEIDGLVTVASGPYTSYTLTADFDGPGTASAVENEAILAEYDSGGGWFIQNTSGDWLLAALSANVTHMGEAWYDDPTTKHTYEPDNMYGVRVSSYASWILANTESYIVPPGDANWDGIVDVGDLGILAANYGSSGKKWQEGDFNADGVVDVGDLGILASHYAGGTPSAETAMETSTHANVPEPATCIFLLMGFAGMIFNFRSRHRSS
jgi:hypothetical protein